MKYTSFALILAFILCIANQSMADDHDNVDWYKIDRIGVIQNSDEYRPLGKNIWQDYSQKQAMIVLDRMPDNLSDAVYRDVARKMLLSGSRLKKEDLRSPDLLTQRLSLLLQYGLFEEAQQLLESVPSEFDIQNDAGLSFIKLQLGLLDNDLPAFCLDIRVLSKQDITKQTDPLHELAEFCRVRFSKGKKQSFDDMAFSHYPNLTYILKGQSVPFGVNAHSIEHLIAHADHVLITKSMYNGKAKNIDATSDLSVKFALDDGYRNYKTYQCYAVEAAKRGVISQSILTDIYKSKKFPDALMNEHDGQVNLHPCDIPAFFYQRLVKIHNDATETDTPLTSDSSLMVNALLNVTRDMPAVALTPFDLYINQYMSDRNQWRGSIVLGIAGVRLLPDDKDDNLDDAMPLRYIQNANQIDLDSYEKWLKHDLHTKTLSQQNIDYVTPLCFSLIASGENNNFKGVCSNNEYEKLFSLTYAKKSLGLGQSFNAFIADLHRNADAVDVLSYLLSLVGNRQIETFADRDVAVILSALKAYKLEKEVVMLSYKYLQ